MVQFCYPLRQNRSAPFLPTVHCPHHNRSGTQGAWWKRAQSSTSSVLKYPIFWPSTKCPMKIKDNYFLWQTLRGCIWMISNFHQSHLSLHSCVRSKNSSDGTRLCLLWCDDIRGQSFCFQAVCLFVHMHVFQTHKNYNDKLLSILYRIREPLFLMD